jgi:hypothetical protein
MPILLSQMWLADQLRIVNPAAFGPASVWNTRTGVVNPFDVLPSAAEAAPAPEGCSCEAYLQGWKQRGSRPTATASAVAPAAINTSAGAAAALDLPGSGPSPAASAVPDSRCCTAGPSPCRTCHGYVIQPDHVHVHIERADPVEEVLGGHGFRRGSTKAQHEEAKRLARKLQAINTGAARSNSISISEITSEVNELDASQAAVDNSDDDTVPDITETVADTEEVEGKHLAATGGVPPTSGPAGAPTERDVRVGQLPTTAISEHSDTSGPAASSSEGTGGSQYSLADFNALFRTPGHRASDYKSTQQLSEGLNPPTNTSRLPHGGRLSSLPPTTAPSRGSESKRNRAGTSEFVSVARASDPSKRARPSEDQVAGPHSLRHAAWPSNVMDLTRVDD